MTDQDSTSKRMSSLFLLRPRGQQVMTSDLGEVVIYPATGKMARELEKRYGPMLDGESPDAVFDAYLGIGASLGTSEPEARGLDNEMLARLTPDDKIALARAGLLDMDAHEGTPELDQPVAEFVARMATQCEVGRESSLRLSAQLKSIGLLAGSPAVRAFEEGNRASNLIKNALGLSDGSALAMLKNAHLTMPHWSLQERLAEQFNSTPAGISHLISGSDPLEASRFVRTPPPLDLHKPTREHQGRLELAGETVIELAEAAVVRINSLADFAQAFQVESAASGRKSLRLAVWALVASVVLAVVQLGYSIAKDMHDGPRDDEQMALLRARNAAATQEIALLRQMLEEDRRDRGMPPAVPPGPAAKTPLMISPASRVPARHDTTAPRSDPMRDGAS